MLISFKVFPPKFGGTKEECKSVKGWTQSFSNAITYNKCTTKQTISLFNLWLHGEAAIWRLRSQPMATEDGWTLDEWLSSLKDNFGIETEQPEGDLITFSQMEKNEHQSWSDFNKDVSNYISRIPKEFYTDKWLAKTYLEIVARTDRDLWRGLYKILKDRSLSAIMREVAATANVLQKGLVAVEKTPLKPIQTNNGSKIKSQEDTDPKVIPNLAELFSKLSLLIKGKENNNRNMEIICYVCGKSGHYSNNCRQSPINKNKVREITEGNNNLNKENSLLAISSEITEAQYLDDTKSSEAQPTLTSEALTKTYLEIVARTDRDLWRGLYKLLKDRSLSAIMREVAATANVLQKGLVAVEKTPLKPIQTNNGSKIKSQEDTDPKVIPNLAELFSKLSLLIKGKENNNRNMEIICYVCGKSGHYSNNCRQSPINKNKVREITEGNNNLNKENSLLAISSEITEAQYLDDTKSSEAQPTLTSEALSNKRMRLDYVTHPRTVISLPPVGDRLGKVNPKATKKVKKALKVSQRDKEFTERLLAAPAPLTLEESLIARPQALQSVIQEFQKLKKKPKR
ncbi:hypothetical protein BB561_006062 [Smittium simulii]|uniref:CCHC-type domain-containing protein n=1 Tax=Smittium simulii TaxID=133385 RepID=A0A2T9Y6Q1_9FUNG|nr:hypothetical protein BB561_006062 [Smittium simulii]